MNYNGKENSSLGQISNRELIEFGDKQQEADSVRSEIVEHLTSAIG